MRLSFHPLVQKDINSILRRYDAISTKLGDQFFAELNAAFESVLRNPGRGNLAQSGARRPNLSSFPFPFLYRVHPDRVRILVVKHHKRRPQLGSRRR